MELDIFHFVGSFYRAHLRDAGYAVSQEDDAAILAYENVRLRDAERKLDQLVEVNSHHGLA